MTSPTTVQTPSASDTKQQVQLPAWANTAGEKAVDIASGIAQTPYTPYGGSMVAPQSSATTGAIDLSKSIGDVGKGAIDTGQDAATAATQLAANSVGTGSGALNSAAGDLTAASGKAASNPGQASLSNFGDLSALGDLTAVSSMGAGTDDASAMSALARLTAGGALSSTGAGQRDLSAARGYTAGSATPISSSDISSYMNPYIEQSLNPAVLAVQRQAATNKLGIDNEAAMRGAFGGSRTGVLEGANERNELESIGNIYQTGFANAFDKASQMATDEKSREAGAAGLSQGTAGQSGTLANDAISRLIQSGNQLGQAGTTQSQLATDSLNRLSGQESNALAGAKTASDINSADVSNLTSVGNAKANLGQTQSQLATSDEDRLLASVNPNLQIAQTQLNNTQQQIQTMLQAGQIDQAQAQNQIDASYAQYLDQRQWAANQLNALISTLSGLPYSTQSTSNTTGFTTQAGPSVASQIAGAGIAAAGLGQKIAASDINKKEDIRPVDDEEVLKKITQLPISTWKYKPEHRAAISDDGETRIGPMAQDFGALFDDNADATVIPMPRAIGALFSAVKALDKRTRPKLKKAA